MALWVDSEDVLCGNCPHIESTPQHKKWCVVFLKPLATMDLKATGDWKPVRLRECKEAELSARDFHFPVGPYNCHFCGRGQKEVKKLIMGPIMGICDECIELCNDIIGEMKNDNT